jgi:hypothetical protein
MSEAAIAGRVAGPTYLSGRSLGTAGAGPSILGAAAACVDRDAEEHAMKDIAEPASTNKERFTMTPVWVERKPGQA